VYLSCRFERADRISIRASGRDAAQISTREDNLIWQTALAVAKDVGETLPAIALEIENDIPIGKDSDRAPRPLRWRRHRRSSAWLALETASHPR